MKEGHTARISGQLQHGAKALRCLRAAANSEGVKLPQTFTALVVEALQRSDTSRDTSRDDLRSISSFLLLLTSTDAMALAETAQCQGERRDLPVKLFNMLHALRLE